MISIVTAHWGPVGFTHLLIDSILKTTPDAEIIVVDNSSNFMLPCKIPNVTVLPAASPTQHQAGLEAGIKAASCKYIAAVDCDIHFINKNWFNLIFDAYTNDSAKLVIPHTSGGPKNFRPFFMFFEKEFFVDNNYTMRHMLPVEAVKLFKTPLLDKSYDVGVCFGYKVLDDGYTIVKLGCQGNDIYPKRWGEKWALNGESLFYHHGWAGRLWTNEIVDGLTRSGSQEAWEEVVKVYPSIMGNLGINISTSY